MAGKKMLSVGDFAKMSSVSLVMLRHYDKLGLLSPALRGENSYRYYSLTQLSEVKLIRSMQELGLSLREIKALKDRRTPARTVEMLRLQKAKIREKMRDWESANRLFEVLVDTISSVDDVNEDAITIRFLPAEPIMLGGWNQYAEGEDGFDALVSFYEETGKKYPGIDLNYPVWGIFSKENLKVKMTGEHTLPERYYFYSPDGQDERPSGWYVIGYARGGYGQNDEVYARIRKYIEENGFEVCGDAYEEYPLNEICVADSGNYLMRVMISVHGKTHDAEIPPI